MKEFTLEFPGHGKKSVIRCGDGCVSELPALCAAYPGVFVVTDSNVSRLYGGVISSLLPGAPVFVMPAGEENKTPQTLFALLERMAEAGMHRGGCLVAFGGGVVGDLGGLAASLYMRGISCIQVPTTLLAQVDSSVGGKTAVDFCGVKNLVGAFHQPDFVLADGSFFRTLPRREVRCGLGEIVKHACLDGALFEELCAREGDLSDLAYLASLVPANIALKADVVLRDEREGGLRKSLNLGHTTAHAFELCDGTLSHGEYVLLGILCEAEFSKAYGGDAAYLTRVQSVARDALGRIPALPSAREAAPFAALDKKNETNQTITITAPKAKGEWQILNMPCREYTERLAEAQRRILC